MNEATGPAVGFVMNMEQFNRLLLESVAVGLAILDPDTLEVVFRNGRFAEWFPTPEAGPVTLDALVPRLDRAALAAALAEQGVYRTDTEVRPKRRAISLVVEVSRHVHQDRAILIVECQNVSKIRELEYMIESYSRMVEKQTRELTREKERAEKLLLNIMPKTVFEELRTFGVTTPQRFESASVLMLDFVGFTEMAVSRDPASLIGELNDIFTSFDRIVEQFGCERIKTIGDAYMAVCGIPEPASDHAQSIARMALRFVRYLERRNLAHSHTWRCRIGINSGQVIGSVVGIQKYVYDIFGPGVNLAARMEALSGPMQITFCEDMHPLLEEEFRCLDRGVHEIKGFGRKRLYTLAGTLEPER
jgi:adenylate cyclase